MLATCRGSISRHLSHARLRHLGACGRISRMLKAKRVALSVRVSEHARDALYRKAEREGHRYPAAFAAALLERALDVPAASSSRGDWLSDIGGVARVFGGSVTVDGDRVTLTMRPKATPTAVDWIRDHIAANRPAPAGVVFTVNVAGGS